METKIISMSEWKANKNDNEPKMRDLWYKILNDIQSGTRFYDYVTLEELSDPKDILIQFILLKDLYIRVKANCKKIDEMSLKEFLEFIEKRGSFTDIVCDCTETSDDTCFFNKKKID